MTAKSPTETSGGKLAANVMHFARVLRAAGLPVGPGQALNALSGLAAVGVTNRKDFYWALFSVFVTRQDQRDLFDQAFHIFWRNPRLLERALGLALPQIETARPAGELEQVSRRLAEALRRDGPGSAANDGPPEAASDAAMTWSAREALQQLDFESMSLEEMAAAKRAVARMTLPLMEVPTRRFHPDPGGWRVDMRATLRASLRGGGAIIPLKYRRRRRRPPPLVILCDISGSMARYSRMLLHFLHAVTNDRDRAHTFLFGTRLTNVTRHLRHRDADVALDKVAEAVEDWSGGTRIGHCLGTFNHDWSRRVLGQGALVLLITDGLDRDAGDGLARAMERLHKSCRRLIWLNPLLRYAGYEPRTLGAQAMEPHVDDLRPVHNLASLADLAEVLGQPAVVPRRRAAA